LCHALFALSVGFMIWHMFFGMSRALGPLASPWSWMSNALLLLQFPLAHSFLLSGQGGKHLKRLAPSAFAGDLAPTTYVIIASLQVLLLFNMWSFSGVIWWQAQGWALYALMALYAASWLLLGKAILDAGISLQTGALGWWAVFRNCKPKFPGMPTRGLFRYSRQPIYFGFACTVWTVPTWTPDQLFVALALTAYCLIGPLYKEARFRGRYGAAFDDYSKDKPYWLPMPRSVTTRNDLTIYDRYAAQWWDGSVRWLRALQNLVPARLAHFDRLVDWRGKSVLDLGCGGGFMSEALARRGALVTGIDPAAQAIAIAEAHAALERLPIQYHVALGEALPLADASLDCVVCVDVLEHVADLSLVLDEVKRVLRPGGVFLFDTINRTVLARIAVVTLGESVLRLLPPGTHDPKKFITPKELSDALTVRGFTLGPFKGLGPVGVGRRFDVVFGRVPTLSILYMGDARRGEVD
jgi:ubiquinone biosynthesis O-methyltransferase